MRFVSDFRKKNNSWLKRTISACFLFRVADTIERILLSAVPLRTEHIFALIVFRGPGFKVAVL
jgi:hypothetical protein